MVSGATSPQTKHHVAASNPPSRENVQKRTQTWSSYYDLVHSNPNMGLAIESLRSSTNGTYASRRLLIDLKP